MPHKNKDYIKRTRGKDKAYERFIRNNGYSNKHIRIKETERERNKIINNNIKLSY